MSDVVFTRPELEALLLYVTAMGTKAPTWQNPDWPPDQWMLLREKLAEACRQAVAIQAGHEAYLARLHAADYEYARLEPSTWSK